MRARALLITSIIGFALALPALAQVYRWTDEDGKVHFGDKPPRNTDAEDISEDSRSTNVDSSGEERQKLNRLFAPETEEEKQLQRKREKDAAAERRQRQQQCAEARRDLRFFQEERFYWVDDEGTGYDASEEERQQAIDNLTAVIQRHCQ